MLSYYSFLISHFDKSLIIWWSFILNDVQVFGCLASRFEFCFVLFSARAVKVFFQFKSAMSWFFLVASNQGNFFGTRDIYR